MFLRPLIQALEEKRPIIKQRYVEIIFSNIEDVYNVNRRLLELIEKRLEIWNEKPCLGDVFLEVVL